MHDRGWIVHADEAFRKKRLREDDHSVDACPDKQSPRKRNGYLSLDLLPNHRRGREATANKRSIRLVFH
jgi:hypothetical protein